MMIKARQARELYSDLSGLASSDEMDRLFSFAVCPNGGFDKNLEGKWFAYDEDARFLYTVPAFGPFSSQAEAEAYTPDYSLK